MSEYYENDEEKGRVRSYKMFFSRQKIVKVAKEHKCEGCSNPIKIGEKAEYNCGVWEFGFYSYYLCNPCREFADNHSDVLQDGFGKGDIGEWRGVL